MKYLDFAILQNTLLNFPKSVFAHIFIKCIYFTKQFILLEVVLWLIKSVYFVDLPGTMLGIVAMVTVYP